jgi:antitoxin component YwqK of YwqJK toxin-antitoxin module
MNLKCTYKAGEKDGPCQEYCEDGELSSECVYKKGEELTGKSAEKYLKQWKQKRYLSQCKVRGF